MCLAFLLRKRTIVLVIDSILILNETKERYPKAMYLVTLIRLFVPLDHAIRVRIGHGIPDTLFIPKKIPDSLLHEV